MYLILDMGILKNKLNYLMEYLFIYGVFRDVSSPLLEDSIFCDSAFIYGKLYRVNKFYPGYVAEDCDNKIHGDVYLIDSSLFEKLDEYEGDEYIRRKIWTSIGLEVWIYEYIHDTSNFEEIESGDWLLR